MHIFLISLHYSSTTCSYTIAYTLSLHDALPIYRTLAMGAAASQKQVAEQWDIFPRTYRMIAVWAAGTRSEEHTSEVTNSYLVCRLLLEKKKNNAFCSERLHAHACKRTENVEEHR